MNEDSIIKEDTENSAMVWAEFYDAVRILEGKSYRPISMAENARLRIQHGKDHEISRSGNWTREAAIMLGKNKAKLVRDSPALYMAKNAFWGLDACAPKDLVDKALENSIDYPSEYKEIPTNRFGEEEFLAFVFRGKGNAQKYGDFLRERGVVKFPLWPPVQSSVNEGYPLRQLYLCDVKSSSAIQAFPFGTFQSNHLRGIKINTSPKEKRDRDRNQDCSVNPALVEKMDIDQFNTFIKAIEGGRK